MAATLDAHCRTAGDALLARLLEDPGDGDARLIYADWCEDNGLPGRAALLRRPPAGRVDSLPAAADELLPAARDHWLRVGLAGGPADEAAGGQAARDCYRAAGLQPPACFVWLDSPLQGAVAAAQLAQVRAQVGDQVRAQVWAQVGDQVGDQVYRCGYGQHDAAWLSFYSFFALAFRLAAAARLAPLMRLAHYSGWWWPFEGCVVLTRRPAECRVRAGRLVRVVYGDGFTVEGRG